MKKLVVLFAFVFGMILLNSCEDTLTDAGNEQIEFETQTVDPDDDGTIEDIDPNDDGEG